MHVHVAITGRVQGVCFRAWTQEEAQALGLKGWVRNCSDGSVEAVFEGDEILVRRMIELCHEGPPLSHVRSVAVTERVGNSGVSSFEIVG